MLKHHLKMVVIFLLASGMTACSGAGGSGLPRTLSMGNTSVPLSTASKTAMSIRSTSATTNIAIDAGSTAAVGNWQPDTDYAFTGWGDVASYTHVIDTSPVSNAPSQSVYQTQRWAPSLTYTIPGLLPSHAYTVRLHFAECWFSAKGLRLFNVSINGNQVLLNLDIFQAAGGANIALAKTFTSSADGNGKITIQMTATVNNAVISGIEITDAAPSSPPSPSPTNGLAIASGSKVAVGNWIADTDYTYTGWGQASTYRNTIDTTHVANPPPQALYYTQRWASSITYLIPKLTPKAAYNVRLHFVECYFNSKGQRVFGISLNGTRVYNNLDIFSEAGGANIAIAKTFSSNADVNGQIAVQLAASVNNAVITGLEVTPGSGTPSPAPTSSPTPAPTGNSSYPNAGWLPYTKGPMVTTVASMYGPNPLVSCQVSGGVNGTCLDATSAGTISNLWGNNPHTFNTMQMILGGTSVYRQSYNGGGGTTTPYFESSSNDATYNIKTCVAYPSTCDTGTTHIPSGAIPEGGYDHHLYIRDTTTNQDASFWISPIPSGNGGSISAGTSNLEKINSSSEGLGLGGTAGNISLAWSERAQDVLAGRIPHALSLRVTCDTTNDGSWGSYVYPVIPGATSHNATDNNFFCGTSSANGSNDQEFVPYSPSNVNLKYGAHLWLDTAPDPSLRGSSGCDIIGYAELRALNEFGGYVNDVGSAQYFQAPIFVNRFADLSDTYDGNPHGTTSYWAKVAQQIGQPSNPGSNWYYNVSSCGINLAQHLHVLVPPNPN